MRRVSKPYVKARSKWSKRMDEINYDTINELIEVEALVVHHTQGNTGASGSAAIDALRSIEDWHMDHNAWSDIGYHFLIDDAGVIYEGREEIYGGSHVDDEYWNSHSLAIACIGNFMNTEISYKQKRSLIKLLAWFKQEYGVAFGEICGHRDKNASKCPGDVLYSQLPDIKDAVADKLGYVRD